MSDNDSTQDASPESTGETTTQTEPKKPDRSKSKGGSRAKPNGGSNELRFLVESSGEELQTPALSYPVVGFGASAGGVQAFSEIFRNLDSNTGMTFVVVTHLAPDQKSFLSEIVERYTQMPVLHIEDGTQPQPNHVYVLQPRQTVSLRQGKFRIDRMPHSPRAQKTIDKFFYSLAADQKNHAIGVVLSGADGDGALGLKAVKGEGGIALVQSPDSAVHSGMPRSSIAADHVDLVIPPGEIGLELGRLAREFSRPEVRSLDSGNISPTNEEWYLRIMQMLRGISGLDFRMYKPETVRRRISRRMLLLRMDHLANYTSFLQNHSDELRLLQEDILINVTRFFRDPPFWDSLRTTVMPALMQERRQDKPVRVWCAGCSSGEEAYSMTITLLEYFSQKGLDTPLQIFGTDASELSIEKARLATYPEGLAAEISPERLQRYFVRVDRGYQLSKRVRDCCIFARQNLATDPPFSHVDLLSCRNVMIYFNQNLQRQVMLTFHYALEPGGYLLLGASEGLREHGEAFSTIDRKHKIYMKTAAKLPFSYEPPRSYAITKDIESGRPHQIEIDSTGWTELELQRAADRILLARYGPAGLIVDERMNVLQSRGQLSQFIEITPGAVSWNLARVLREGLSEYVIAATQRSNDQNIPVTVHAFMPDEQGGKLEVQVEILPITSATARPRCSLVLFQLVPSERAGRMVEPQITYPPLTVDEKDRLIPQLRQDLDSTRFHLQTLLEERDSRNQELVSANQEIQSANEELQSTNEELETIKEELQSANEELQTVNDELQQRNNILTQTGNDLSNLLNSVNIPLLMLTTDLHIRQFTPPMQKLLNVRPSDIGRAITEIRLQLSIEDIQPVLHEVLDTLGTREEEVQDRDGRWHLLRVRPYRTTDNKIDGLVVVLMDIDQLRRSQQDMMDARDFSVAVVESMPMPIVVLNDDCRIRIANTAFRDMAQMRSNELGNRSLPDLAKHLWGMQELGAKLGALLHAPLGEAFQTEHVSTTSQAKILLLRAKTLSSEGNRVILLMMEDITLRRQAEEVLSVQREALVAEIGQAANTLTKTQAELRGLTGYLFTVQEEERQRVARELHDDISQRLSLLEILLHEIHIPGSGEEDVRRLESAREHVHSLNTDVRQISHRLHPSILNDLGLSVALKAMVKEFGDREKMPVTYLTRDLPESWSTEAATAIYRIAQEALRNVSKHAGKTHVKVTLTGLNNRLELRVTDFGVGFDQDVEVPRHGLGLVSMQERARLAGGTLTVESTLGQGTNVIADVPVERYA